jgi:hypothetical protein
VFLFSSQKGRKQNRALRHLDLSGCRELGVQGGHSAVAGTSEDWRLRIWRRLVCLPLPDAGNEQTGSGFQPLSQEAHPFSLIASLDAHNREKEKGFLSDFHDHSLDCRVQFRLLWQTSREIP